MGIEYVCVQFDQKNVKEEVFSCHFYKVESLNHPLSTEDVSFVILQSNWPLTFILKCRGSNYCFVFTHSDASLVIIS